MRVEAVEGIRVRGERLECGGRRRKVNIVPAFLDDGPELRALLDHVHGLGERFPGLVFLRGDGVYLRRALVVGDEHIERERREEGRLAVFPAHQKERLSKAPIPGLFQEPPEKSLYKCLLEKLEA